MTTHNNHNTQPQPQQPQQPKAHAGCSRFVLAIFCCAFMWSQFNGEHAGAAMRRRQRRLRQWLRHERLSVAISLAESHHHAAPRGQSMARAGGWERAALHGQVPEHPTPQVAGTQYFAMDVDEVPATGSRPDRLAGVRPQEHVKAKRPNSVSDRHSPNNSP